MDDSTCQKKRVFGIGTVVIDHVVVLPSFPEPDTKCAVQSQWRQIGGPVPVALSTAAFYGAETSFAGRWGNDHAGREIEQGLTNRGIDLTASHADGAWSTGFAHVWTEAGDGRRTIAFSRGDFPEPTEKDVRQHRELLDGFQILHLDGWAPAAARYAATLMKQRGGLVVLDAGSKKPGMETLLTLVDVLIASDLFCRSWFGHTDVSLRQLRSLGCNTVVRTRGADGAHYFDGHLELHVPAIDIEPVDTNGAGDIFAGVFLYGLSNGWAPQRSLSFANAVAGHACGHRGNSAWPSHQEVAEHLNDFRF